MRHPHMVLLLGACPEYGCLVYEYMENGSLEDRLFRKNNTPPLSWKTRFKMAAEIGTALLFLHQSKQEPLVHRDLKPANILLSGNYVSKISDVGLARMVPPSVADSVTQYHMAAAAGTFCYIDPEYQQTGMLGTKSDLYSLGLLFVAAFRASLQFFMLLPGRKVHQMLISVSFQSIDFKSVLMKISLQLELVEWFPLQQAVGTSLANVLLYLRMHFAKKCEYVNTMVSFIWWMVGFYWVVSGGEILLQSAPRLY